MKMQSNPRRHLARTLPRLALLAVALGLAAAAPAAPYTWTNGGSGNLWSTVGNWNPVPATAPGMNSLVTDDIATFTGDATAIGSPNVSSVVSYLGRIEMLSAGWTIGDSLLSIKQLNAVVSEGAGVNTIRSIANSGTGSASGSFVYQVGTGNTLVVGSLSQGGGKYLDKVGTGTMVITTSMSVQRVTVTGGELWVNCDATGGSQGNTTVGANALLGGTGTVTVGTNINPGTSANVSVTGTLAPGGNGTYGSLYEDLAVVSEKNTNDVGGVGRVIMLDGSTLRINLGTLAGENSALSITSEGATGGHLDLTAGGVTLELLGPAMPSKGEYIIATFDTQALGSYGTFAAIAYNGSGFAPYGEISYNADSIVLNVTIPEPASLALLAVGGLLALRRRRI